MKAEKWTDGALERLEKRIIREFSRAVSDLNVKYDNYINGYDEQTTDLAGNVITVHHAGIYERYEKEYQAYLDGAYHDETGRYTDEQMFNRWWVAQEGRGRHIERVAEDMSARLEDSAKIARDYTNGVLPKVYTINHNSAMDLAEKSAMEQGVEGINFNLVTEEAVARLVTGSRELRPYKPVEIDLPKINNYNYGRLQNELLQGILQGETPSAIAERFRRVSNMTEKASIRNARTAVTGAQNRANIDAWEELEGQGCETYKMWLATNDDRTRETHSQAESDYGSEENAIPYDEPFSVGDDELMYPADPNGSPEEIYNCRCTMKCFHKFRSMLDSKTKREAKIRIY